MLKAIEEKIPLCPWFFPLYLPPIPSSSKIVIYGFLPVNGQLPAHSANTARFVQPVYFLFGISWPKGPARKTNIEN